MINHQFTKSLSAFKTFMTGSSVPNYVTRYCMCLDEQKWQWFYEQIKEATEFVTDMDYFFYVLKWILKHDFDDLSYEIFIHDCMDPEMRLESLIKDEYWDMLQEKYNDHLMEIISEMHTD